MTVPVSTRWNVLDFAVGTDLRGANVPPWYGIFNSLAESSGIGAADGIIVAATKRFSSATANFVDAHIGGYIVIWGAVNPGNNGNHVITDVIGPNDVTLGNMSAPVDEAVLNWLHRGGGEDLDWAAVPAGGWGVQYGRGGANVTFYMIRDAMLNYQNIGILPDAQGIRPNIGTPYAVLDLLEGHDWEYKITLTPAVTMEGDIYLYCGRASDGIGGAILVRPVVGVGGNFYQVRYWNDTTSSWDGIASYVQFTGVEPISVRIIYNYARNTLQVFLQDIYLGEVVAGTFLGATTPPGIPVGITIDTTNAQQWVCSAWQIGTHPHYGDIRPNSHAGMDRVSPIGRWVGFDGKNSEDPDETEGLSYFWKLFLAPSESSFIYQATDGTVISQSIFESLSTIFYVPAPGSTQFSVGDLLMIQGVPYEIVSFPQFGGAYHRLKVKGNLPSGYTGNFQVILQGQMTGNNSRVFSFEPDVQGLYAASLEVMDSDGCFSRPDFAVCNVISDNVPLGVPLDMSWLWNYLGDFWKLVNRKEWIQEFWMSFSRLTGSTLNDAWNADFDKSLVTTQNVVSRRWLLENPSYYEQDPDNTRFVDKRCPAMSLESWNYVGITTAAVPGGPVWVVIIRLFGEEATLSVTTSIAGGTSWSSVPSLIEASISAAAASDDRWSSVHCNWKLINETNTNPATPHAGEYYRIAVTADSYIIDVSDNRGYFMPSTPNYFVGSPTYPGQRLSANTVRLWAADPDGKIQAGDLLSLGGRPFAITGIKKYYTAVIPYVALDVEVSPDIPETDYSNTLFWCIPSYWTSLRTPWYDAGVTPGDLLITETRPVGEDDANPTLVDLEVCGAGARSIGTVDPRAFYPTVSYKLNHVRRHFYISVPTNLLEMPRLQQDIDTPTWIMEEFKDYFVDNRRNGRFIVLDFRHEPSGEMEAFSFHRDRTNVAFLQDWLWAELAYFDNRKTVEDNFGRMVGFYTEEVANSPDSNYLSIITSLWKAYSSGPTPDSLNSAAGTLGGFPYSEASGTILRIVEEFVPGYSYAFIRDDDMVSIVRSYVFPTGKGIAINPSTGVAFTDGDHIDRFQLLVQGQIIFNYLDDPDWWLYVRSTGLISEVEKSHRFGVMLDVSYVDQSLFQSINDFILDLKKTHTSPLVVAYSSKTDDIEIEDEVTYTNYLYLPTAFWSYPVPPDLDVPRLGSGTRFEQQYPSEDDTEFLVRMRTSGDFDVRVRLVPDVATSCTVVAGPAPEFDWDITCYYVPGTDLAAQLLPYLNDPAGAGAYIEAYLPPGAVYHTLDTTAPGFRVDARVMGTSSITLSLVLGLVAAIAEVGTDVTVTVVDGATSMQDIVDLINTDPASTLLYGALLTGSNPASPLAWYGYLDIHNWFRVEALASGIYSFAIVLGGALGLVEGAGLSTLTVVAGVTTIQDVVELISGTSVLFRAGELSISKLTIPGWAPIAPTAVDNVWGPVDVLTGSGAVIREAGWHDVNPRGKNQLRLDSSGIWSLNGGPVYYGYPGTLNYSSRFVNLSAGPNTLLGPLIGDNPITTVTLVGNTARIAVVDPAPVSYRLHDNDVAGLNYITSDLICKTDWMVFYDVAGNFRSMAPVIGMQNDIPITDATSEGIPQTPVVDSNIDGTIVAATRLFSSPTIVLSPASVDGYIEITNATNPGNLGVHKITGFTAAGEAILGDATTLVNEVNVTWRQYNPVGIPPSLTTVDSGLDGTMTAIGQNFNSPTAAFTAFHVGGYIRVTGAVNPGNNGMWRITALVGPNDVTLGEAPALVNEGPALKWSQRPSDGFGPGNAGATTYVDVLLADPAGVPIGGGPGVGDSFVIFRGMPDRTLMDFWDVNADTFLVASQLPWPENRIFAVNPVTPPTRYQIQVAAPHFFSTVGGPHLLFPGQDYLLIFDDNRQLSNLGVIVTVDNGVQGDLATIDIIAGTPVPVVAGSFVILRNPPIVWTGTNLDEFERFFLAVRSMGFERGPFAGTVSRVW